MEDRRSQIEVGEGKDKIIVSDLIRPDEEFSLPIKADYDYSVNLYHHPNSPFTLFRPNTNPRRNHNQNLRDFPVIRPICINPVSNKRVNYGRLSEKQLELHMKHHTYEMDQREMEMEMEERRARAEHFEDEEVRPTRNTSHSGSEKRLKKRKKMKKRRGGKKE